MDNKPQLFSIILPVKNGGHLLKECVNSILSQHLTDFNLLVLDSNSTDDTVKYLESLNDNRIIIYKSEKDLSIVENWARILTIQKNEFITLIGHDDILYPNYLQDISDLIERYPDASLYQTRFNYIDANGVLIKACKPMASRQTIDEFLGSQMNQTIDSMGTGYMMRSKDFDLVGGMPTNYPNLIFADYELWMRLTQLFYKATSDKFGFSYRVHNSVSKTTNGDAYAQAFQTYLIFISTLLKNEKIKEAVEKYGYEFLIYFCQSLSHRILKTPFNKRKIRVDEFIKQCEEMAKVLIPNQSFEPLKIFKIKIAKVLDANNLTSNLFRRLKNISS